MHSASISALETQVKNREGEIASITSDQARVRENMKALRGSAEERSLTQQYARQLQLQEERLGTLHKEISDLQQKRGQAQAEMEDMMERITVDQQL